MSLNVELLEQSFDRIKPCADEFVASFYENLFIAYPEVRPLFANTEMEKQQKKLLNALILVVENLRNPSALEPVLNALGARHVGYGSLPQQYPAVGQTLLLTFEQYLQDDWTPELKQAWADAYEAITAQMLQGVDNVHPEAERSPNGTLSQPEIPPVPPTAVAPIESSSLESGDSSVAHTPLTPIIREERTTIALSEQSLELLESSFEKIKPRAEAFAASFYDNLFQAYPEVKPMFGRVDMAQQQQKLLSALVLVVENLRNPDVLGAVLNALGERHVGYGTLPQQYPAVGKALLLTFEQYLQDDWTPQLKKAWTDAYGTITAQMLQGVPQASVQATPVSEADRVQSAVAPEEAISTSPEPQVRFRRRRRRLQEFQTKFNQAGKAFPRRIFKQSIEVFWSAPVWSVAAIAVVTWIGILVVAGENTLIAKVVEGADTIGLILALVLFIKETPDRRKQFHYQAWGTIDAAHGVKVSYARILALQDLNEGGVPLRGLDAPGAELVAIQLPNANLSNAHLHEADLSNADLNRADLSNANLRQAKLVSANLSYANLSFAQLTRANFSSANLSHANLICSDLSSANLSGANLRNASLSGANLAGAYLTGANLKGAKVSVSELNVAFLEGATLPDGSKYKAESPVS